MITRLRALPGRTKVFILLALALPILAFTGVLTSDNDVDVTRDEALEIARTYLDFEPVTEEARIFRQSARLHAVWAVVFTIPEEGNPREFERRTSVELDARTGEVLRVSVDNIDEFELEADSE
ncbi:MAG: hypothetical protein ACR2PK_04140 [Acidimicrobiales bacterium]